MPDSSDGARSSARELLQQRDYLLSWAGRWATGVANQILSVTIGWHVYGLARQTRSVEESAFVVGMIGLASFVPVFFLTLPAGETADRYNRKRVIAISIGVDTAVALVLAFCAWRGLVSVPLLLGMASLFGAARAFSSPANSALGPMLVPRRLLPRAIAWYSLSWQSAAILGPALGGVLVALSPAHAYLASAALYLVATLATLAIRHPGQPPPATGSRWALIKEGLAYVWRQKTVFGAISLDLFAVLLGGATALLPVFARDILHVGAEGFGLMRSAPAVGATLVGLWVAVRPPHRRAGLYMFGGVAAFGLATCAFALSRSLWVSAVALAVLGGADMLSVYVRSTLVQLITPDPMRGRVSAVSMMFIGASNELGEAESGVVARFLGPVGAALFGGVGALFVTGLWAKLFPELRDADKLE